MNKALLLPLLIVVAICANSTTSEEDGMCQPCVKSPAMKKSRGALILSLENDEIDFAKQNKEIATSLAEKGYQSRLVIMKDVQNKEKNNYIWDVKMPETGYEQFILYIGAHGTNKATLGIAWKSIIEELIGEEILPKVEELAIFADTCFSGVLATALMGSKKWKTEYKDKIKILSTSSCENSVAKDDRRKLQLMTGKWDIQKADLQDIRNVKALTSDSNIETLLGVLFKDGTCNELEIQQQNRPLCKENTHPCCNKWHVFKGHEVRGKDWGLLPEEVNMILCSADGKPLLDRTGKPQKKLQMEVKLEKPQKEGSTLMEMQLERAKGAQRTIRILDEKAEFVMSSNARKK